MNPAVKSTSAHIPDRHLDLVRNTHQAVLSTVRHSDGELSANPVGYTFDGEVFRISTLKSRVKYKNVQADPRVALCIVDPQDPTVYVEIRGHATLEEDLDRAYVDHQFRTGSGGIDPPDDLDPPDAERVVIVLRPSQVSAPLLYGGRFSRGPA